jgi:hypothetical protein
MKYDLVITYRICPKLSKNPAGHFANKFELSKFCLLSMKKALEGLNYKIYALLDGCPKEYESLFTDNFNNDDLEIIHFDSLGNKKTWKKEVELLSIQNDSEIIYCAEDDYFYIENIKDMVDLIRSGKADFVTPYEHPGCYTDGHIINSEIIIFNNKRYMTVQHACFTFMTTKKTFLENRRYFLIFSDWFGSDFVTWGCITLGLNYFRYIKLLFNYKNYSIINLKVYGSMFLFAIHRFIFNKKYKLFMPIQSFATHMEKDQLAPGIDWGKYFKK